MSEITKSDDPNKVEKTEDDNKEEIVRPLSFTLPSLPVYTGLRTTLYDFGAKPIGNDVQPVTEWNGPAIQTFEAKLERMEENLEEATCALAESLCHIEAIRESLAETIVNNGGVPGYTGHRRPRDAHCGRPKAAGGTRSRSPL